MNLDKQLSFQLEIEHYSQNITLSIQYCIDPRPDFIQTPAHTVHTDEDNCPRMRITVGLDDRAISIRRLRMILTAVIHPTLTDEDTCSYPHPQVQSGYRSDDDTQLSSSVYTVCSGQGCLRLSFSYCVCNGRGEVQLGGGVQTHYAPAAPGPASNQQVVETQSNYSYAQVSFVNIVQRCQQIRQLTYPIRTCTQSVRFERTGRSELNNPVTGVRRAFDFYNSHFPARAQSSLFDWLILWPIYKRVYASNNIMRCVSRILLFSLRR